VIVLVINCGSSSLRIQLINARSQEVLAKGLVERIGAVTASATFQYGAGEQKCTGIKASDHTEALNYALDQFTSAAGVLNGIEQIQAVGHRVVHGGEAFSSSVIIDDNVKQAIVDGFDLAPLHNPANLAGINAAQKVLSSVPHVAAFDTAFHQTLPEAAYLYAIPYRLYRRYKVRRYGFHGISHGYVSQRFYELADIPLHNSRLITCHLGNGCSMTAIRDGVSIDTSMGLTPLSGLVMGTRSGDIDPAVIFYLMEKEEMSLKDIHTLLNRQSGLLGLSEYDSDMRAVIDKANAGDPRCASAIEAYCYRVRSYIGQYVAVLGGCDGIVFTGGIGENSPLIRSMACRELECLGIRLDEVLNAEESATARNIASSDSAVRIWIIPTNEELVIAREAMDIAQSQTR